MLPDFALTAIGAAIVIAGILVIRHADRVASFSYSMGRPMFGKLADRTYTGRNMKWAGDGYIGFGLILILILGLVGVLHSAAS